MKCIEICLIIGGRKDKEKVTEGFKLIKIQQHWRINFILIKAFYEKPILSAGNTDTLNHGINLQVSQQAWKGILVLYIKTNSFS